MGHIENHTKCYILFLKKWANPGLFLFILVLFSLQFQLYQLYESKKAKMVCLGFKPRAAGW